MIDRVAVVVPVRDEELLLPRCLDALAAAAALAENEGVPTSMTVVLDRCLDRSAEVVASYEGLFADLRVVVSSAGRPGPARAAGVAAALATTDPARAWVACTDADSVVPVDWLVRQLGWAEEGWDAVVGTITVDSWAHWSPQVATRFGRHYEHRPSWADPDAGHHHVHGANLVVRGAAYLAAGGFPALEVGEDQALVAALVESGARVLRTAALPVMTSGRCHARASGGFAAFLSALSS